MSAVTKTITLVLLIALAIIQFASAQDTQVIDAPSGRTDPDKTVLALGRGNNEGSAVSRSRQAVDEGCKSVGFDSSRGFQTVSTVGDGNGNFVSTAQAECT